MQAEAVSVHGQGVFKLIFAKQACVDEDVCQAIADRFVDQDCCDGGVYATAQTADSPFVADLSANCIYGFLDKSRAAPFWFRRAYFKQEIAQDFRSAVGVIHFGMEFDRVNLALSVFDCSYCVFGFGNAAKAGSKGTNVVAMTIPHAGAMRNVFEEKGRLLTA